MLCCSISPSLLYTIFSITFHFEWMCKKIGKEDWRNLLNLSTTFFSKTFVLMSFLIRYNLPMLPASWMIVSAKGDNVQGSSECPVHRGDSWSGDQHKVERDYVLSTVCPTIHSFILPLSHPKYTYFLNDLLRIHIL